MSDTDNDEEPNKTLSWRGDPESNHSDWTIIISTENQDSSQTYHVHRNILAASRKYCKYFSTLFQTKVSVSENQEKTSRITIGETEAEAFPIMLDYVYSPEKSLEAATTQNAVALQSLARYFRCRELMKSVNEFIQHDLSPTTAVSYLKKAFECSDDKLEDSARKLIVEKFIKFKTEEGTFVGLPVHLFRSIIHSPGLQERHHPLASTFVKEYFEANPEVLSAHLLYELTSPLSSIDPRSAHGLMHLIGQLDPNTQDKESWLALDRLVKLCADALGSGWKNLDTEKCMDEFKNPSIVDDDYGAGRLSVSLLASALNEAKADYKRKDQEVDNLKEKNLDQANEIMALRSQNAELERAISHGSARKRKRSSIGGLEVEAIPEVPGAPSQALDHPRHFHPQV
jgi:hypothetical protein